MKKAPTLKCPVIDVFLCIITAAFIFIYPCTASFSSRPGNFSRDILGLYDSDAGESPNNNPVRSNVERILNHLGLRVSYHDVSSGFLSDTDMRQYRGIICWFSRDGMKKGTGFWNWIQKQVKAGKQVVFLDGIRPLFDTQSGKKIPLSLINKTLNLMGLEAGTDETFLPFDIEVVYKKSSIVEFERKLDPQYTVFNELHSLYDTNTVYLTLLKKSTGTISDEVVVTPRGGAALNEYVIYSDPLDSTRQLRLNLFEFLSGALNVKYSPRLDCTTINGSRIFFSHIDGDGFLNISYIDRKSLSAEIIYERILKKFPSIPVTVSVIVADMERGSFAERSHKTVKEIYRLTNVEPASHTYAHPLIWNIKYLPGTEIYEYPAELLKKQLKKGTLLAYDIPGYTYDPRKEILFSVNYIKQNLLPPGKNCNILLWSGNCLPDEAALKIAEDAGILNMNGGDGRMDGAYPSYTYLAPLYRKTGSNYQVHTANINENLYTHLWTDNFGGFQNVIQTFEKTGSPRRVSPVNVYYHFYSGEHTASLTALEKTYQWASDKNLFPVFASRYIGVVRGFIRGEIENPAPNKWVIKNNGECRTVRFDNFRYYPDLDRSQGILGFDYYQGNLYVHLDEGSTHLIVLTSSAPSKPYLVKSTADVIGLKYGQDRKIRFESKAFGGGYYKWNNLKPKTVYNINIQKNGEAVYNKNVSSDTGGRLDFSVPVNGTAKIEISPADEPGE